MPTTQKDLPCIQIVFC